MKNELLDCNIDLVIRIVTGLVTDVARIATQFLVRF
jgi:hypothetical protein